MKEVMRTVDQVALHFAQSVLRESGIEPFVLDTHTSVLEGSIGFLIPRRLMVADEDYDTAFRLLREAGLDDMLREKK